MVQPRRPHSLPNICHTECSEGSAFLSSLSAPAPTFAFSVTSVLRKNRSLTSVPTADLQSSTVGATSLAPFFADVAAASSVSLLFATLTENTGGGVSLFLSVFYRVARSLWMRAGGPIEP